MYLYMVKSVLSDHCHKRPYSWQKVLLDVLPFSLVIPWSFKTCKKHFQEALHQASHCLNSSKKHIIQRFLGNEWLPNFNSHSFFLYLSCLFSAFLATLSPRSTLQRHVVCRSLHEHGVLLYHIRRLLERKAVQPVHQVLVQPITVLVLFHRGVK